MIEAAKQVAQRLRECHGWFPSVADTIDALCVETELLNGYRDRALALATAYNRSLENAEQIAQHRDHALKVHDQLRAENAQLKQRLFEMQNAAIALGKQDEAVAIREHDALVADAEKWRQYKARKDAVIAAGMGRNPMREQITDPAEIRRVFELDDAEMPPPESGFMKLEGL